MKPILKWAGGKTQLLNEIKNRLPDSFENYCEPFFGGGALFFDLKPKKAILNDFNKQLYNLYLNIKTQPIELKNEIDKIVFEFNGSESKSNYYYDKRDEYNKILNEQNLRSSALLVFLNKTCFNGLYRTNSKGFFNVPFSKKEKVGCLTSCIGEMHQQLKKARFYNGDFEKVCTKLKAGDFVYFDPPYYNTFEKYQAEGFNEECQRRLANLFKSLTDKGVYCMLSNSNEEFIKQLYKGFYIDEIEVRRNINRNGSKRKGFEIIVTNYKKEEKNA